MHEKNLRWIIGLATGAILSTMIALFGTLPNEKLSFAVTMYGVVFSSVGLSLNYDVIWNSLRQPRRNSLEQA